MSNENVMVLLSGGMDSTVCAAMALTQKRLRAVAWFNYGQPFAANEGGMSRRWALNHSIEWVGAMLPHNMGLPMKIGVGQAGPRIVPARNTILVSCAASYAVTLQTPVIWYGANADDQADYADCRQAWIDAMSEVLHLTAGIRLEAPLIHMHKADIVAKGNELGVDWEGTWSCYQPRGGIEPCGTCNACVNRQRALEEKP